MISIIVPIYNVEKYINRCVDSIINQTYKNLEIILVDDGSPDNCPKICDDYENKDSRVSVIHKSNGGLMSARQAGLRAANGDYVGFVDGDDWIEPDMYEKLALSAEKYHSDLVFCEFLYAFPDKDVKSGQNPPKEYFTKQDLEKEIYPTMLFREPYYSFGVNPCCWSKLFKKELLESVLYNVTPKVKIGEDAAFTYPALLNAKSVSYVGEYLYHYRNNPEAMTKKYDSRMENYIFIPYDILNEAFGKTKYAYLNNQLNFFLLFLVNGLLRNEASPDCNKSLKEKRQLLKRLVNNDALQTAIREMDCSVLPFHTRLIVKFLSMSNVTLLYLYTLILRIFL